jgi:flagellar biosynthetic protein FliQ
MTPDTVANLGQEALRLAILMSAPLVGAAALVGILFGVLQALTQLQDQTASFAVKLIVVFGLLLVLLPWLGALIASYGERVLTAIGGL